MRIYVKILKHIPQYFSNFIIKRDLFDLMLFIQRKKLHFNIHFFFISTTY